MMKHYDHFFAVAAAFLAAAILVAVVLLAHGRSTSSIYTALVETANPEDNTLVGSANADKLCESAAAAAREGARWAHEARYEVTVWLILLFVLVIVLLGHRFWVSRGIDLPGIPVI